MRAIVLVLMAGVSAWAQSSLPQAVFPSDSHDPLLTGGAELLETVCPGQVVIGKKLECRSGCPDYTMSRSGDWTVGSVIRGHFVSPLSDDAVLDMDGCEPHAHEFGGTILLTRGVPGWRLPGWKMVWYNAGVRTDRCHKVALPDGRDILVCLRWYGNSGGSNTSISAWDLSGSAAKAMGVFAAPNDNGTCGLRPEQPALLIRSAIDKVEFLAGGGAPTISVTAHLQSRWVTPQDRKACELNPDAFLPPAQTYRMEFVFDVHAYQPAPSSSAAVRLFDIR